MQITAVIHDLSTAYFLCCVGVTVDTLQLYTSSEGAANSSGELVLFQWPNTEHIKQTVSGTGIIRRQ